MKGVVLAGGLGTRLYPLTLATNKHLLPVYNKCMVQYPLETLVRAGIRDMMLVTGGPHAGDFLRVLGDGRALGFERLQYTYQRDEGGIAHALRLCEDFAAGDPLLVVLGDNITDADLAAAVEGFPGGARVFLKTVENPREYGVPAFDDTTPPRITRIIEKPATPPSDYAVTGLYMYDARVFEYIRDLKPSARGELEITDVNNAYLADGQLSWAELDGVWLDAGESIDALLRANLEVARWRESGVLTPIAGKETR